jgi:hypothetical protein
MNSALAGRASGLRKDGSMKRTIATIWMAACALLLLGFGAAQAQGQSLGDYARSVRKNKPETGKASHHYDNDNLPTKEPLSIVGPPPAEGAKTEDAKAAPAPASSDSAKAEQQKANDELQKKIDDQKQKLDSLSKELDMEQREYRLRVAQYYTDPNNRLQNSLKWDEENKKYQSDVDTKQKAIDSAREQLEDLQKNARDAGIEHKDSSNKDTKKDSGKDDDSNKK